MPKKHKKKPIGDKKRPTPSVWKALDKWADYFQRFEKMPVFWDNEKKEFKFISNPKEILSWYFNVFIIVGLTFLSVLYTTLVVLMSKENTMPLWRVLCNIVLGSLAAFGVFISVVIIAYGEEAVATWNILTKLERNWCTISISKFS